jgi:hypothetical protein
MSHRRGKKERRKSTIPRPSCGVSQPPSTNRVGRIDKRSNKLELRDQAREKEKKDKML